MNSDDRDVLERARTGDDAAFERIVRRLDARVLNLAYRLLGDADQAADVRQAAFVRLHRALPEIDAGVRLEAWLARAVVNLCRDRARAESARRRRDRRTAAEERVRRSAEDAADEPLLRAEAGHEVASALGSLCAEEREVIVLRHYQGLAFPEIARLLGAPITTVKSRAARALSRLRERLAPDGAESRPDAETRR